MMSKVRRSLVYRQYLPFHPSRIWKYQPFGTDAISRCYQPTWQTEMGQLQERITSTKKGSLHPSKPSMCQLMTHRPSASNRLCPLGFNHQLGTWGQANWGSTPAVDPLSFSALSPEIAGEEHYAVASEVKRVLQRYHELQDIIAILGMYELSDEEKTLVACACRSNSLVTKLQRCGTIYRSTWFLSVPVGETVRGFKEILDGKI